VKVLTPLWTDWLYGSCPKQATHTKKAETQSISTLDLHTQRSWERGRGGMNPCSLIRGKETVSANNN